MEKTRVAIIDLGTNTFNLLVTEIVGKGYRIIGETKYPVKLGKGGIHRATITEDAIERAVEAITNLLITISEYQVDNIFCYATSAIRSATNGDSFVNRLREDFGLTVRVIPGDEEAEAIYDGVKQVVRIGKTPVLIVDIGGGSVEFIIANKSGILWKNSYDIGLARLIEQFNPSEPIRITEIEQLEEHFDNNLKSFLEAVKKFPIKRLIGSSGSFDTLAAMIASENYPLLDLTKVSAYNIELDALEEIHNNLLTTNFDGRRLMPGMDPDRVDNMVVASVMVQWVLKKVKPTELIQSSFALKEGSILQIIQKEF